ncbi:transcriptional regulator [Listeria welshimeri]|nr:transcriptional regulator [Listeria welshimeri]
MAGFIKAFLNQKDWTFYQLGNATGVPHQTLRSADSKSVDQLSAKNVRLIAELFDYTPGELLDEFYEKEVELTNEAIIQELVDVFEKHGYNAAEVESELLNGKTIKLPMEHDDTPKFAEAIDTETEHFYTYLDPSTDNMIVEFRGYGTE